MNYANEHGPGQPAMPDRAYSDKLAQEMGAQGREPSPRLTGINIIIAENGFILHPNYTGGYPRPADKAYIASSLEAVHRQLSLIIKDSYEL